MGNEAKRNVNKRKKDGRDMKVDAEPEEGERLKKEDEIKSSPKRKDYENTVSNSGKKINYVNKKSFP